MAELSNASVASSEQLIADASAEITRANSISLDLVLGTQKAMLEEAVFAGNELLDRTQTEIHLFSEFISKMAGSHSVKDLKTMGEECAQHQIDFVRRDCNRLFKHGERMIETASKLFKPRLLS